MNEVTLDHVRRAAEWALTAKKPVPIDGLTRSYDQSNWDCDTACCMWGAANIMAGNGPANSGPPGDWAAIDKKHLIAAALMRSPKATPEQMLQVLRGADLSGADLSGADLSGAQVRIGNVYRNIQ